MDDIVGNQTCATVPRHLMGSHKEDSPHSPHSPEHDPIRCHAGSLLDAPIDTSYRTGTNTTRYQQGQHYDSHVHSHQQQGAKSSIHQREGEEQPQLDPLMFHARNNDFYNHFNRRDNHVLLLSWTLSILLGLLVPVFALLYDAYMRITSKSRHQKQLQAIQKALKPYKRKVLTKSQAKETCPICLSKFAMGESILICGSKQESPKASGCSHCFHQPCMVPWLLQQTKNKPQLLVETILSNEPAMSTLRPRRKTKLEAPCPCCRQPFVTIPLVR
jgi:hypothetical protein